MIQRLLPVVVAAAAVFVLFALGLLVIAADLLSASAQTASTCAPSGGFDAAPPSEAGLREIPPRLVPIFREAAATHGLGPDGWAWLAAVNRIETDFGRDLATSAAGAIGWMQFEPSTWSEYGVDGDGDGRKDPYDPADAVPAAAGYLRALGAPADWQTAIRGFNGGPANARAASTLAYWRDVATHAAAYLGAGAPTPVATACEPCSAPDPAQVSDTLVAFDPVGVPDARGGYGFTPQPGTVYTVGQEPQIAGRLDALGRALHLRLTGISGYRTPGHSIAVGGGAGDPHTRGEASDTPGIESVPEATLEQFGLTRPFDRLLPGGRHTNPAEADHIQLLGSSPAAGALAGAAAALPAAECAAGGAV
ncbi:MAG: lytic murein transglycosylase, partial [Solirubrobacteraceae bacterium]